MKKSLLLVLLLTGGVAHLWAQNLVSGTVTSAEGSEPLSGVSVIIEGTTTGTFTDVEGKYTVDVPSDGALTFSYLGYSPQTVQVDGRNSINVNMAVSDLALDEVVVTAFGLERNKKALNYSVTEVDGADFTEARELNVANSLAGKVAGVNVSSLSTGPAGSSRVIIRGAVSLTGNNQPLYVIDGIPMDNSGFGQAGMWGGDDEGDGTSSLNPDDIESVTVLKGANAAALYGSRASNGVILITTKKGSARKGIGISINSNFVFEDIINLTDYQTEFGQGRQGQKPLDARDAFDIGNSSWGARLDGSMVGQWDGVDRPYSYVGDNLKRFYNTGSTLTNTVAFSGGNEKQNFRLSASDLRNKSVIPNAGYNRQNVSLSFNGKYADKLTITSKVLYSFEEAKNRPRVADSPGNAPEAVYRLSPNVNVLTYRRSSDPNKLGAVPEGFEPFDGKGPGEELQNSNNLWGQNPYWAAHQFENTDRRDRVITSHVARFDVTDFLYAQGRVGMDFYVRRERDLTPYGTGFQRRGSLTEREQRIREINIEGIIGFDKQFGDLSVNVFGGGNWMRRSFESLTLGGNNFNIPFFHTFANLANQTPNFDSNEEGINSLFGSATLGYKDLIFLTSTARTDWFSTLNPETNDILYPSVGGSFVFSELLNTNSGIFTFGKLRASWAQVGGDTDPYRLNLTYNLGQGHVGQPNSTITQNAIPNQTLVPLTSTEYEAGVDLRFFNNRIGLDITYYNQTTTDDILNATISQPSGFSSTTVNIGEMKNQGIEFLLTGSPIQSEFVWDVSLNFAYNDNEVVSLSEGIEFLRIGEPRTRFAYIHNIIGEQFSTIVGFTQKMINGQPVFDPNNGQPIRSDEVSIIGNGVHNFNGGITNTFNWKGIYVDFLVDFRAGGDIYSGTNVRLTQDGLHKQTVENTSGLGFVANGRESITVNGVNPDGEAMTLTIGPDEIPGFWGAYGALSDRFVYDASFVKLRQVSAGYSLPSAILASTPFSSVSLSFVGRNLAILFSNMENVDPESNYSNVNAQGFDYFSVPQTRSFGFNLRVGF